MHRSETLLARTQNWQLTGNVDGTCTLLYHFAIILKLVKVAGRTIIDCLLCRQGDGVLFSLNTVFDLISEQSA